MYVLLELDAHRDRNAIRPYGVDGYPAFAVLDAAGQVRAAPDDAMREMMFGEPFETAGALMGKHQAIWSNAGAVPPDPDVVIAQLMYLVGSGETATHDQWLAKALAAAGANAEMTACLKVYKALYLRGADQRDAGLALLKEVAPKLTFAEASAEAAAKLPHALAPFTVSRDNVTYGTVSSDADARLAADALLWLNGLQGDIPKPEGLGEDILMTGAASLAAVLNRPLDAEAWVKACADKLGSEAFDETPRCVYASGLVLAAQGKDTEALKRLDRITDIAPGANYCASVAVRAYELAVRAKDDEFAKNCLGWINAVYGSRLPKSLRARLPQT